MKKIIVSPLLFVLCSYGVLVARGGGDSFVGGMAGGMVGGLMSGAMTKDSSEHRSRKSATREIDRLENAVRYDLLKLDERINTIARDVSDLKIKGGGDNAQALDDLKTEIKNVKSLLKKFESSVDSKIELLEERFANLEKNVKKLESKTKQGGEESDKVAVPAQEVGA